MGLKENEAIEHPMVSRALKNAQQKLEKQVLNEHTASSQEEWFRRNIPAKQ
jgi:preprotein translocase subunit SecA